MIVAGPTLIERYSLLTQFPAHHRISALMPNLLEANFLVGGESRCSRWPCLRNSASRHPGCGDLNLERPQLGTTAGTFREQTIQKHQGARCTELIVNCCTAKTVDHCL